MASSNLLNAVVFVSAVNIVVNGFDYPGKKKPFWVIERYSTPPEVCNTTGCLETAKRLLDYMDLNANPCEDFYRFACGKFMDNTEIPPDKTSVSSIGVTQTSLLERLKTIFDEPAAPHESHPHHSVRRLYSLCMDDDSRDRRGVEPLLRVIEAVGGWPVLGRWQESLDFVDIELRLRREAVGYDSLLNIGVSVDPKNTSRRVITVGQSQLPFHQKFLARGLDDEKVQDYYNYTVDMAVLLGADRAVAEQDMWDCLALQVELAKAVAMTTVTTDNMYNLFTLESLRKEIDWIDWFKLIKYSVPFGFPLTVEEPIVVLSVDFFNRLRNIIRYSPKRVVANYLVWSSVHRMTSWVTSDLTRRTQEFIQKGRGKESAEPHWQTCITVASSYSHAISSLYVKRFFNESAKKSAEDIVDKLERQMVRNIENLDWMDDDTRAVAISKVKKIKEQIGFDEEILNNENLEDFYKDIVLEDEPYFEALQKFAMWTNDRSWKQLRAPVDKFDWRDDTKATDINGFYNLKGNIIKFPAGILQPPFFRADVPNYVNYATIGRIIGHEIVHGFDNKGSKFDENGTVHDWWGVESKKHFDQKKQCMINQYSQYQEPLTKTKVDGNLTLGENVADNGGLKLAFKSWQRQGTFYTEDVLPGLEYFQTYQLFLLLAANLACSKWREEPLRQRMMIDPHAPEYFRVIGVMQNFPDFGRFFKCAKGTVMNPEKKCEVW